MKESSEFDVLPIVMGAMSKGKSKSSSYNKTNTRFDDLDSVLRLRSIHFNADREIILLKDSNRSSIKGLADSISLFLASHNRDIHSLHAPCDNYARKFYDITEMVRCVACSSGVMPGACSNILSYVKEYFDTENLENITEDENIKSFYFFILKSLGLNISCEYSELFESVYDADAIAELKKQISNQSAFAELNQRLCKEFISEIKQNSDSETGYNGQESDQDSNTPNENEQDLSEQVGASDNKEEQENTSLTEQKPIDSREQSQVSYPENYSKDVFQEQIYENFEVNDDRQDSVYGNFLIGIKSSKKIKPYKIYTSEFDEIVYARDLASEQELKKLRGILDQKQENTKGNVTRLANRLRRKLMSEQERSWKFDMDDGVIDSSKLARIICSPNDSMNYKQESMDSFRDTVVSVLIDNSGSMRGRPIATAAICSDILAKSMERAGVKVELLGFTTREWKGGKSREKWIENGKPINPGRLNDLRHIIYKAADTPWRKSANNLGLMLKEGILKENIDGEALSWAYNRIAIRPEKRKIIVVISDGAPVDDSTISVNNRNILEEDLKYVIDLIHNNTNIELVAIGIGHDVSKYYYNAVMISGVEELGKALFEKMDDLFIEK